MYEKNANLYKNAYILELTEDNGDIAEIYEKLI